MSYVTFEVGLSSPWSERNLELNLLQKWDSYRGCLAVLKRHLVLASEQAEPRESLVFDSIVQKNCVATLVFVEGVRPDLTLTALIEFPELHSSILVKAECTASLTRVVATRGR